MIKVRPYHSSDAAVLLNLYNTLQTGEIESSQQFSLRMEIYESTGGIAWVLEDDGEIHGYATLTSVPGLDGVYELGGGVDPDRRRRGLSSAFLKQIIEQHRGGNVRQISHPVESTSSPVALFLRKHGFQVEHSEWGMSLDDLSHIKPVIVPEEYELRRYPNPITFKWFRDLYDSSFLGLPWYQPYQSEAELSAEIAANDEILFLLERDLHVGFIWLRWPEPKRMEIEPIGVVESHQSRGLGRILIQAGLDKAAGKGAEGVTIGTWSENTKAIGLYRQLGFKHIRTKTYLAYDT